MKNQRKKSRKPFFRFVKSIVKIFRRRPKFVYLGKKPQGACIYISNHSAASGPTTYELYLPADMRMWSTYEMCGTFKERWKYLNEIYFRQKKKRSKISSFMLATFVTPFVAMFYKGMKIIPTYPDYRLAKSLKTSISELKNGTSILIFPENSSDGYHETVKGFFGGFYVLAKYFYEKTGRDIDIVDMYYDRKSNTVAVGEPRSYCALSQQFTKRDEVAEFFMNSINKMFTDLIKPFRKKQKY